MKTSTVTCYSYNNQQGLMMNTEKRSCWRLTLFEILTILCAAAIPIAVGVYTAVSTQEQIRRAEQTRQFDLKQATELRQQTLYDKFLADMYNLDKDGHLDDDNSPWVFANAYHRAAHRQWDNIRKADVLQFLQEKQLIGKTKIITKRSIEQLSIDKIRLNELNFDNVYLTSQTNSLNKLNLKNIFFDQVSMINASFLFVNLDETSFNRARLNYAKFDDSSLAYAIFDTTELQYTNFGNSNLTKTKFLNVNLMTTILSQEQIQQAIFVNITLPNGTFIESTTIPESLTTIRTTRFTPQQTMISHPAELSSQEISLLWATTEDIIYATTTT